MGVSLIGLKIEGFVKVNVRNRLSFRWWNNYGNEFYRSVWI